MREAMNTCQLGDDVFADDITTHKMQEGYAKLFGKEEALLFPSGTMSNLVGVMLHANRKGDGLLLGDNCHIYLVERGGMASVGDIMPIVAHNQPDGTIDLEEIERCLPAKNDFLVQCRAIALEQTHNFSNGSVLSLEYIKEVEKITKKHGMTFHVDAARGLNAAAALDLDPAELFGPFQTVNLCISKGLGCPIGSVLVGSHEQMKTARTLRKMLGGGMRQTGVIASCGLVALEDWRERLNDDHRNAANMARKLSEVKGIKIDLSVIQSNIFRF